MSNTRNRDIAVEASRLAREKYRSTIEAGGITGVSQRMAAEVAESILIGVGEIYDLGGGGGLAGEEAMKALSAGVASFLLSVAQGNVAVATQILPGAIDALSGFTLERFGRPLDAAVAPRETVQ